MFCVGFHVWLAVQRQRPEPRCLPSYQPCENRLPILGPRNPNARDSPHEAEALMPFLRKDDVKIPCSLPGAFNIDSPGLRAVPYTMCSGEDVCRTPQQAGRVNDDSSRFKVESEA